VWVSENGRFAVTPFKPLPGASPWRRWIAIWDRSSQKGKSTAHVIEWHLPINGAASEASQSLAANSPESKTNVSSIEASGPGEEQTLKKTAAEGRHVTDDRNSAVSSSDEKSDWVWLAISDDGKSVVGLRTDLHLSVWEAVGVDACGAVRCSFRNGVSVEIDSEGGRRVGESDLRLPILKGRWRDAGSLEEIAHQLCTPLEGSQDEGSIEGRTESEPPDLQLPESAFTPPISAETQELSRKLGAAGPAVRFHADATVGRSMSVAFAAFVGQSEGNGSSESGGDSVAGVHCGCCGGVLDLVVTACHIKTQPGSCRILESLDRSSSPATAASVLEEGSVELTEAVNEVDTDKLRKPDGIEGTEGAEDRKATPDAAAELEQEGGPKSHGQQQMVDPVLKEAPISGELFVHPKQDGPDNRVWTTRRIGSRQASTLFSTRPGTRACFEDLGRSSGLQAEPLESETGSFPGCFDTLECQDWRRRMSELLTLEWDPSGDLLAVTLPGESSGGGRAGRLLILNHELRAVAEVDWEKEVLGLGRRAPEKNQSFGKEKGSLARTSSGNMETSQSGGQSGGVLSPTFPSSNDGTVAGVLFRGVLFPTHEPHATASGGLFSPPANGSSRRGLLSPPTSQRVSAVPSICSVTWAPSGGAILAAVDTTGHVALFDRLGRVMSLMEGTPQGSKAGSGKPSLRSFFGRSKAPSKDSGGSENGPRKYLRKEVWTQGLWEPDAIKDKKLKRSLSGTFAGPTDSGARGRTESLGDSSNGSKRAARSTSPFRTLLGLGRTLSGSGRETASGPAESDGTTERPYFLCMFPSTNPVGGGASVHLAIGRGKHVAVWTVPGIGSECGPAMLMATAQGEAVGEFLNGFTFCTGSSGAEESFIFAPKKGVQRKATRDRSLQDRSYDTSLKHNARTGVTT
jgi:hypothetical protein